MLIRASGSIEGHLHLLTLGDSCHYLLAAAPLSDQKIRDAAKVPYILFDPGCSAHIPFLVKRIESLGLSIKNLSLVLLTHLHAERMAGISLLRKLCPHFKVIGTSAMRQALARKDIQKQLFAEDQRLSARLPQAKAIEKLSFEEFVAGLHIDETASESDILEVTDEISIRSLATPGHTPESISFYVMPHKFLIGDEGLGYTRGHSLIAPGGDASIPRTAETIERVNQIEVTGLCSPWMGIATGELIRKNLHAATQNQNDLLSEIEKARLQQLSEDDISKAVLLQFYVTTSHDEAYRYALKRSYEAICHQLDLPVQPYPAPGEIEEAAQA